MKPALQSFYALPIAFLERAESITIGSKKKKGNVCDEVPDCPVEHGNE